MSEERAVTFAGVPEGFSVIEALKTQALMALIARAGGEVHLPIQTIDAMQHYVLMFTADPLRGMLHLQVGYKH